MSIKDKVALITGAASGIGLHIAQVFAKKGAKVVIADLDLSTAEQAAASIEKEGGKAFGVAMNVTDEKQVNDGFDAAVKHFGGLDILISNAGVQHIDPIDQLSLKDWQMMLDVHLNGAFLTTKAALRVMYPQKRGGSIIYMGSAHSKVASKLKAPYVTCKHGLLGLCRVVALEGAEHGVRSNVICPGYVRTPLVEKQIPEQAKELGMSEEEVIKKVLLVDTADGEFTTLDDVANLAVFFAGFDSNALTGQSLLDSHGWGMD
ncbi:MAG: 3-hydroxybutyrate dehydrogenase [Gammaproteobacteria bacterium]|nr:3-hydroxybutyrate dehydrogenase [Gammaproteobacteria bacterium]